VEAAVIFDMDGLLVDSEPLWWQAGVEVLRTVGVELDESRAHETMGLRTDAALRHSFRYFPWTEKTFEQVEREVNARMMQLILDRAEPLPGVHDTVRLVSQRGISIGLCSSSPYIVIEAVLHSLRLRSTIRVAYSAEDEPLGKPHPGAYLTCASRIGVRPGRCIAFEDSLNGAISAKAAQMKVVAVPSSSEQESSVFDFCDARIQSLEAFDGSLLDRLLGS